MAVLVMTARAGRRVRRGGQPAETIACESWQSRQVAAGGATGLQGRAMNARIETFRRPRVAPDAVDRRNRRFARVTVRDIRKSVNS
jgi:hypothetical protein